MPKDLKAIRVYECDGDQHGDMSHRVYFNSLGESISVSDRNEKTQGTELIKNGFTRGTQSSDINAICVNLHQCIFAGDNNKFAEILARDFFYTGPLDSYYTNNDHSKGDWSERGDEYCWTRPVVEKLFFDKNDAFADLIDHLLKANNEALYDAFISSLNDTDLSAATLFSWPEAMKDRMLREMNDINAYSKTLAKNIKDEDALEKSGLLSGLYQISLARIGGKLVDEENAYKDNNESKFATLKFKLALVKDLHSEDATISVHRGYLKRIAANFFSILFTAGIANLAHWCSTGNWMFFSKTTSEDKIAKAQTAVGFASDEKIKFNNVVKPR